MGPCPRDAPHPPHPRWEPGSRLRARGTSKAPPPCVPSLPPSPCSEANEQMQKPKGPKGCGSSHSELQGIRAPRRRAPRAGAVMVKDMLRQDQSLLRRIQSPAR